MDLSIPAIFAGGLLTFVSPCILPLVPLYLSFLAGRSVVDLRSGANAPRLMPSAVAFSLGLALVFVLLGLAASAAAAVLEAHRQLLLGIGAALILLFALRLLGLLRFAWLERDARPLLTRFSGGGGLLSSFLFGAAFALGWTPCVGPVLGSVLTFTASTNADPATAALYLSTFAAGLVLPLLLTAAAAPFALRLLERARRFIPVAEKLTGATLAASALYLGHLAFTTTPAPGAVPEPMMAAAATAEEATMCEADGEASCSVDLSGETNAALATFVADGPRLLQFTSQTCPVCERMKPVVRDVEAKCGATRPLMTLDVGEDRGRSLARKYAVRGVPTYVFVDASGKETGRLVGEQQPAELVRRACGG